MRLKNNIAITASLLFSLNTAIAQVNPKNVEIIRDTFGVPHIYAKTDAGAAYGLAWANAEGGNPAKSCSFLMTLLQALVASMRFSS